MASVSRGCGAEESESAGLVLCPRNLCITWAEDARYWTWERIQLESQDYCQIDVPELLDVCWLEVRGSFNMSQLTANTRYEVKMEVMLKGACHGWQSPVTLHLRKPDCTSTCCQVNLNCMPRNKWQKLVVGSFKATGCGEVEFSLTETESGCWKKGLLIKRVLVKPVNPGCGVRGLAIYPRDMCISWGSDARYWKWNRLVFSSHHYCETIEVPKLLAVCWLEIRGKFEVSNLRANTRYEVVIVAMLKEPSSGWECPVTLLLRKPGGCSNSRQVTLKCMPSNRWLNLVVGDFLAAGCGEVEFSMMETKSGSWKKGLIIKHVLVRPVNH